MSSNEQPPTDRLYQELARLDELLVHLRGAVDRLSWLEIDEGFLGRVEDTLQTASSLRAELTKTMTFSGLGPEPHWRSREQLDELIAQVSQATERVNRIRLRLRSLASELGGGAIQHRLEAKRLGLEAMKRRASEELLAEADSVTPLDVLGPPSTQEWLRWALELHGDEGAQAIAALRERFAALAEFVENMELTYWLPAAAPSTSDEREAVPPATPPVVDRTPEVDLQPAALAPPPALVPELPDDERVPSIEPAAPTPSSGSRVERDADERDASDAVVPQGDGAPRGDREQRPRASTSVRRSKPPTSPPRTRGAVASVSTPLARLAPELQTFDRYRTAYWISPHTRQIEPAPARDPDLPPRLDAAIKRERDPSSLQRLWLWTKALEILGHTPAVRTSDLEAYAAIWTSPLTVAAGQDEQRSRHLRRARQTSMAHAAGERLRLMLEALRPSTTEPLSQAEINDLIDGARFKTPELGETVRKLLTLHARGFQGIIVQLREALGQRIVSVDELQQELRGLRLAFHAYVLEQWSACHGQVQQTFCRRVWTKFIESIAPTLRLLYPPEHKGAQEWDVDAVGAAIAGFVPAHRRISDDAGVRRKDRKVMDRVAAELARRADAINEIRRRILHDNGAAMIAAEMFPLGELRILGSGPCNEIEEEFARQLLVRHLEAAEPRPSSLDLRGRELCAHPDLLNYFELDLDVLQQPLDHAVSPVTNVLDAVRAAATWVSDEAAAEVVLDDEETIFENLRRCLVQRKGEPYPPPLAQLTDGLTSSEQQRLLRLRTEILDAIARSRAELHRLRVRFDEHAVPMAAQALADIVTAIDQVLDGGHIGEPSLYRAWLKEVLAWANSIAAGTGVLTASASHIEDVQLVARIRETEWRQSARTKWPQPLEVLAHAEEPQLIDAWRTGITAKGHQTDRRLRSVFARAVLPWLDDDAQKQSEALQIVIKSQAFLDRFAHEGFNPCYLPQVAAFQDVVILTPSVAPHSPQFLQRLSESVSGRKEDLSVVLAPKLQPNVRDQAISMLRSRGLNAAVLDDLDLCRLLNPGGSRPEATIGLFEIALEQLDPKRISPFRSQRMEMFVGRRAQAEQIFHGRVSRLFSGRKLGKSSLLRFLQHSYDTTQLPSGNVLHVVYVNIPGKWDEAAVVEDILLAIRDDLGHQRLLPLPGESPGAHLERDLKAFIQHRQESLLIVLDEADQFVASQIEKYDQPSIRESCLSFRMSRAIEEFEYDSRTLPRIRFLFSGYRTTNTVQGVWNNWGEVMRLRPLDPHEAAALIAGPLARLGIDALDQAAAIAFRCGCQPAVLLRFGQALFDHVTRTGAARVTAEDVVKVFQQPDVEDEIRTVVEGNFQGNKLGEVIFHALLLEFGQHPPGSALDDAEDLVLKQLAAIDPDLSWLERHSASALDAVERQLRDLTDRHLLLLERDGERTRYRLRFPHHLMLLRHVEPEQAVQELGRRIRAFQQGGGDSVSQSRTLLPSNILFDLHELIRSVDADYPLRAVILPSLWQAALVDPTGGIPAALGFSESNIMTSGHDAGSLERTPLIVRGCRPETAVEVARTRSGAPAAVLLGGLDLYRWTLAHLNGEHLIELRTTGRMAQDILWWWFARVRCLEFNTTDAFEQIWRKTSGIPYLVRIIDEILIPNPGSLAATVTAGEFRRAINDFDARLPADARALVEGPEHVRLTPREIEILRMVAAVSTEAHSEERIVEHLTDVWDAYLAKDPTLPQEPLGPADDPSISLLIGTGMLPAKSQVNLAAPAEQLKPLHGDDAVYNLLRFIQPQ